ncbi:MAG: ATP-grasp domain-containing protein [Gaiella sp.]
MSSPRLLVLGAGPAQLGLLEAARARGDLHVIAADRDAAAIGFPLADERAVISTEDEQAIERLARARHVAGIVSPGADWPVGIAARTCEKLGLPHPISAATGTIATTKTRQRECFAAAGVPHAATVDPAQPTFPCVVKAPDRQGQRGLALVRDPAELEAALAQARAESRGGAVLVEELIEGPELTANGVFRDGVFFPLTLTDRMLADPPAFGVALAHVWRASAPVEGAFDVAAAACSAIGIEQGPVYVQLRVAADGPRVMEVAARLGGGHDAELCEVAMGVDLAATAIAFALGERLSPVALLPVPGLVGGACVRFLVPPEGTLVRVDGAEEALALPGVRAVRIYRQPGHVFGPFRRGADRAGAVLAAGATREEALARAADAADAVRFVVA